RFRRRSGLRAAETQFFENGVEQSHGNLLEVSMNEIVRRFDHFFVTAGWLLTLFDAIAQAGAV
ncbi:hypothetical protein, partial [Castellaniella sp.]|uniref:hypothetical protein n=1 Tax=Castellaniella sp. TaxID=1955812 RepID=UPI003C76F9C0